MSATARPDRPFPRRTVQLPSNSRSLNGKSLDPSNTDFELNPSPTLPPAIRLITERGTVMPSSAGFLNTSVVLDPEAKALFHHRLFICCLVAAVPFLFFVICASTNFIELFGRSAVGRSGLGLSIVTFTTLLSFAGFLYFYRDSSENLLRVVEIAIFGMMALFFAYWQFSVLTASPPFGFQGNANEQMSELARKHEQMATLAAALIVHFNWFALIVFHGVLVPNTISRGVGITFAMCVVAVGVSVVAATTHPPVGRYAVQVFAISVTMLAAGAGLGIFGTAKIAALQHEVLTAREVIREMGQYRLRRKLGQGGMGEVYLAEHRLLKRPCALKRIHTRYLNNPEQLRRFEREVQATAQLRHPNTVEIYDYGVADDGTFYYVMEYLNGLSLEDLVARHGPQPADRVVHIMRQVCGALREAHRHGMVHRDIKPSNILIFPDGAPHDQVKVVDFGLVHSLADELNPDTKITREGLIVGTPEYMSPEQASGGSLDGRSDLFSLGSVAYYLLTGKEAFHRDNPMKTLLAVVNESPLPIVNYNPLAPDDVIAIVKKCLGKLPHERFVSAADLEHAFALSGCGEHWTEERSTDWWSAHPDAQPGTGTDLSSLPMPEPRETW